MKNKLLRVALVVACVVLGAVLYLTFSSLKETLCKKDYHFINPEIACEEEHVLSKASYASARKEIATYINEEISRGRIKEASVYFRDLRSGPVFGVGELEEFAPASLLKTPLALAYLSYEEAHPGLLAEKIRFTKESKVLEQITPPEKSIKQGEWYTIEEVLYHMIVYSDNISYGVLGEYIKSLPDGEQFVFQTYQELGVIDPTNSLNETLSVQGYASIFRQLYNASFLSRGLSEKMLGWLAEAEFESGLSAGLPSSVDIAHKFGERMIGNGEIQLHDCGIVYYPRNPYSICIMTRGGNWEHLAEVISTISRKVYFEVHSRRL